MNKKSSVTALSHIMYDTRQKARSAISQDGCALQYVRKDIITKAMCESAVKKNALALQYVPSKMLSADLIYKAVEYYNPVFSDNNTLITNFIPKRFLSKKLCTQIFKKDYRCFVHFPDTCKTKELCYTFMQKSDFLLTYDTISSIPYDIRNDYQFVYKILFYSENKYAAGKLLQLDNGCLFDTYITNLLRQEYNKQLVIKESSNKLFNMRNLVQISCSELSITQKISTDTNIVNSKNQDCIIHSLTDNDDITSFKKFYYVTDIHLEHQLSLNKIDFDSVTDIEEHFMYAIRDKVAELFSGTEHVLSDEQCGFKLYGLGSILLVGGDVSFDRDITLLFYQVLREMWHGTIICVLGNHELWDGYPSGTTNPRTVDEIVEDYRRDIALLYPQHVYAGYSDMAFLHNDIYVRYKNMENHIIREKEIIDIDDSKLSEILFDSSIIILGGVGFSGLNPVWNTKKGQYRSTLSNHEQDMIQTERFYRVYEKINRCAGNRKVIVLTHMPVYDWKNGPVNPNWIYVNGHTHENKMKVKKDKCAIFSDNQIGYAPIAWSLKGFSLDTSYDLFEKYNDGIYTITSKEYVDFNRGKGIDMKSFNRLGTIYMLKRNNIYMFLLETKTSLCLLNGGSIRKLTYNINYYYENMVTYVQRMHDYFKPYRSLLNQISKEIQLFNGTGEIHGCIVDISYYSHVYLNPLDGKITPYYANDISSRYVYENVHSLLENNDSQLLTKFEDLCKDGKLCLLNNTQFIGKSTDSETMSVLMNMDEDIVAMTDGSQCVKGTEIYTMSRIVKALQYIWDYNVIRIWNDDIVMNNNNSDMVELINEYDKLSKKT